ncbi:hypothetical protein [Dokdonella sp.]|uniref:hypothetical protein n=1 Tax=Dokdonella sp. TaxID=2291710 RepID=UPI001B14801F|nr:hypothetical protein [Dokdonella sp.]MBO9662482.1 hypothetical protein [Dokdonella sp.]
MHRVVGALLVLAVALPASAQAETWKTFEDSDGKFWDTDARLEVDLDSVRKADVAKATDVEGHALSGPFFLATRRAVLSDHGREALGYDSELASEYYHCAGETPLRTANGSVLSADITDGKQKIKYQGRADEAYAFAPATTGWQKNLQSLVCARARAIGS